MRRLNSRPGWILYAALTAAVYQLLLIVIMSRILTAEEIGLYSLLLVFSNIATVLQDGGLANYIVHRQKLSRPEYSTVFLLSIGLAILTAALLLLAADWLALWYQQEKLTELIPVVAITLIVNSCITPYQASMLVYDRQIGLAKTDIISRIAAVILAIMLLYVHEMGIISALLAGLFAAVCRLLMLSYLTPKLQQPCFGLNLMIVAPALRFGVFQTSALLLNQLRTRLDQLIIGKLLGMETLAIYSLAKELISQPTKFVTPLIQNILFPKLAKLQQQPAQQQQVFSYALKAIAWSNLVIFAALALCAGPMVTMLYGNNYFASAAIVSLLSAYGVMRTMGATYVSIAQAHGRSDLEFYWNIIATVVMGSVIWCSALSHSIVFVAAALALLQVLMTYVGFYFFRRSIAALHEVEFFRLSKYPVLTMLLISVIGFWLYAS